MSDVPEFQFFTTNGIRLHAAVAGPVDGPLVVLLHGFPEFWYGWHRQISPLAAAGYRVVALDQRGYNLSDKPPRVADYCLDLLAADVRGVIDVLGRERALVVGHDWGAAVAWWMGVTMPERLAGLGIINVPHPAVMRRALMSNFAQLRRSWYMFALQTPWLPERMMARGDWQGLVDGLRSSSCAGAFRDADFVEYRRAWSQPGAMRTMIHWYRAALRYPPQRVASPRVRVPTRIVWGPGDKFVGRELAEPSRALCDDGELEFIEGATHWVVHEEPELVSRRLVEFAGRVLPTGA